LFHYKSKQIENDIKLFFRFGKRSLPESGDKIDYTAMVLSYFLMILPRKDFLSKHQSLKPDEKCLEHVLKHAR